MKRTLGLLAILAGCGSDPVNVEGTWTISGTFRDNGCNVQGWNVGDSFSNVNLVLTQNDEAVNGEVSGGGGDIWLSFFLGGDDIFSGSVDDNEVSMVREGTRAMNSGNCTYTFNAELDLTVTGNLAEGRMTYRSADNGNSDCAAIVCSNYQDLSGNRPPP